MEVTKVLIYEELQGVRVCQEDRKGNNSNLIFLNRKKSFLHSKTNELDQDSDWGSGPGF